MPVAWEIDPTSEDAGNAPLLLIESAGSGYRLTAMDITPPPVEGQYAGSVDTEGDPAVGYRHLNRIIRHEYLVRGATAQALETAMYALQQKVEKLRRERGTLKLTTETGDTVTGDVLNAQIRELTLDRRYVRNRVIPIVLEFECLPYFRGVPVLLADHAETTLPVLIFTETNLPGDVDGLGKLVIDDDQGINQWAVWWGVQSRYYDAAASAALFYEAEGRTPLGAAATHAGPGGASGGGSPVIRTPALTTAYQAYMSTQASGGGAHLSHVGTFRVFARVQRAAVSPSSVYVALEWGRGDFRTFTRNTPFELARHRAGTWVLADLGLVVVPKATQGAQRWEGRIVAYDVAGGEVLDFDCLFLLPADEGSGKASAIVRVDTPSTFQGFDDFNQSVGALVGKTAGVGGIWAGAGDTDDFGVVAGGIAERAVVSDTDFRFETLPTNYTDTVAQVNFKVSALPAGIQTVSCGVLARYVDILNYVRGRVTIFDTQTVLELTAAVAGAEQGGPGVRWSPGPLTPGIWYSVRIRVDADGQGWLWFWQADSVPGAPKLAWRHSALATGGALASGKNGMLDRCGSNAVTRNYDRFRAWAPTKDAAIFASQSVEIRANQVIREDAAGTVWQEPSDYEGDYLLVPPARREGRSSRLIVMASQYEPSAMPHAFGDLSARLTYTPRYLVLPA